jgi:hypothetical protein
MAKRTWLGARRTVGTAVTGVVVVAAGMLAGAGSAAGDQAVAATLTYSCLFPSGEQQVGVQVGATFPASGVVGQPIAPADVAVNLTVPRAALTDLTAMDAASVAGTVALATVVAQNGVNTPASWSDLAAPSAPLPSTGDLTLAAAGAVPPVTASATGDVTFTAADLVLVLTPQKADGTATDPPTLTLSCALAPADQNALLATVPVQQAAGPPTTGPAQGTLPGPTRPGTPSRQALPPHLPLPGLKGTAPRGSLSVGPLPGGRGQGGGVHAEAGIESCGKMPFGLPPKGQFGVFACTTLAGFSNVNKLNGASFAGGTDKTPALFKAVIAYKFQFPTPDDLFIRSSSAGKFVFNGRTEMPPSRATFLTFGFMPTTATMHLEQKGLVEIEQVSPSTDITSVITSRARFVLRLDNVVVNGVPLDVGPHCQTVAPLHTEGEDALVLTGFDDGTGHPYSLNFGGLLTGTMVIPPFTGCGVGEDLDPIFTASISGSGNVVKFTQGPFCSEFVFDFCPPQQVNPQR